MFYNNIYVKKTNVPNRKKLPQRKRKQYRFDSTREKVTKILHPAFSLQFVSFNRKYPKWYVPQIFLNVFKINDHRSKII